MPRSNGKLKAIVNELERRRTVKETGAKTGGSHLVALRLNEYVPPPCNAAASSQASTTVRQIDATTNRTALLESVTDDFLSAESSAFASNREQSVGEEASRHLHSNTIICQRCGKCRCERCLTDRPLPPLRVNVNDEPCTVDTVIDTVTCMRVVGSVTRRMHAARRRGRPQRSVSESRDDDSEAEEEDEEETVGERVAHWSVVSALSVLLPCVVCYWPLRGARAVAKRCYNAPCVRTNVCHCRHRKVKEQSQSKRRVLHASFRGGSRVRRFVKTDSDSNGTLEYPVDSVAQLHADRSISKLV